MTRFIPAQHAPATSPESAASLGTTTLSQSAQDMQADEQYTAISQKKMAAVPAYCSARAGARALVGLALLSLAALVATPSHAQAVGPITRLVVTQTGQGPADNGCPSFRLSAKQAQAFFKRAILITGRQNHDHFDHGPCTVSGTFKTRFDSWEWEIRNGGTAAIMASNGDSFQLADPRKAYKDE